MRLTWKPKTGKYEYGSRLYLGSDENPILAGETTYPTQSKSYEGPRWHPVIHLPSRSFAPTVLKETEELAKLSVEGAVKRWMEAASHD